MNDKLYKLMNWPDIEEIVYSECDDSHILLGAHKAGSKLLIQAFFPNARAVSVRSIDGKTVYPMECAELNDFMLYWFRRKRRLSMNISSTTEKRKS